MKQPAFVGLKTNRENELEKETTITAFIAMTLIEQCKMLMEILNLLTQQKRPMHLNLLVYRLQEVH